MTADSTPSRRRRKTRKHFVPPKPYPKFPLTPHSNGKWQKRIKGELYYFGRWGHIRNGKMERLPNDGWEDALKIYDAQAADLHAGRKPSKRVDGDERTVAQVCNEFLTAMYKRLEAGKKMSPKMFAEYQHTAERLCAAFGKSTLVSDLRPRDFTSYGMSLHTKYGPYRVGNEVQKVKTIFKFGYDNELLTKPIRYGSEFKKPDKDEMRKHQAKQGKRLFTREEIRQLLDGKKAKGKKALAGASTHVRAMILLGINCGFGNNDVASLSRASVDLIRGWVEFPRPKNGIERRCPLWPETVAAIKKSLAKRPAPKNEDDADCVFVTKYGQRWVIDRSVVPDKDEEGKVDLSKAKCVHFNSVAQEFGKLLRRHGINGRKRLGFYALRHTFRTVADATKDFPAARLIMGHADNSIDGVYREQIDDDRLQAVVDHVHGWLFGKGGAK